MGKKEIEKLMERHILFCPLCGKELEAHFRSPYVTGGVIPPPDEHSGWNTSSKLVHCKFRMSIRFAPVQYSPSQEVR